MSRPTVGAVEAHPVKKLQIVSLVCCQDGGTSYSALPRRGPSTNPPYSCLKKYFYFTSVLSGNEMRLRRVKKGFCRIYAIADVWVMRGPNANAPDAVQRQDVRGRYP